MPKKETLWLRSRTCDPPLAAVVRCCAHPSLPVPHPSRVGAHWELAMGAAIRRHLLSFALRVGRERVM